MDHHRNFAAENVNPPLTREFNDNRVVLAPNQLEQGRCFVFGCTSWASCFSKNGPCCPLQLKWWQASKSLRSESSHGSSKPAHGLDSAAQSNQSHCRRSAQMNFWRSKMPSLPKLQGCMQCFQATRHWPPLALPCPHPKKRTATGEVKNHVCILELMRESSWSKSDSFSS